MCKLAVLAHLPHLRPLLLNPYYHRQELFQLEVYHQNCDPTPLDLLTQKALRYSRCHQTKLLQQQLQRLEKMSEEALSPLELIKIRTTLSRVGLEGSSFRGGHGEAEKHS